MVDDKITQMPIPPTITKEEVDNQFLTDDELTDKWIEYFHQIPGMWARSHHLIDPPYNTIDLLVPANLATFQQYNEESKTNNARVLFALKESRKKGGEFLLENLSGRPDTIFKKWMKRLDESKVSSWEDLYKWVNLLSGEYQSALKKK